MYLFISEEVFNRGMLTRKAIHNIQSITLKWLGQNKQAIISFDFYRERIEEFAAAKKKTHRAEIIVVLATIGWNGIFRADDIAKILLDTDTKEVARERALAKLDEIETNFRENERKAAILRKGIEQVLPKTWQHEMSVSAIGVDVRFFPPIKKDWISVLVDGAENVYAFLQMIMRVRPMLHSAHIPFDFDTFSTMANVWHMGESKIAYGCHGWSGKKIIESEKKAWRDYFADYKLPDHIKIAILDCLQEGIADVKCGVYHDAESGSYNSLVRKPFLNTGLWTGTK